MKNHLLAIFLACFPLLSFSAIPEPYTGIWATQDSVFDGEIFLGGLAFYVDKDGTAILFGGPLPPPGCAAIECVKVGAMKVRAEISSNQRDIMISCADATGNINSGVGFRYDPLRKVLQGEMMSVHGKTLLRKAPLFSPELMRRFLDELVLQERDQPANVITYIVPGSAMKPALKYLELALADVNLYRRHLPQRGDIAVYAPVKKKGNIYIRRIVGLPGDIVEIKDAVLVVNGQKVEEPYVLAENKREPFSRTWEPVTVPEGMVFLLGDNRDFSVDSRFEGPVPLAEIAGKVYMKKPSQFEGEFYPVK